MKNIKIKTKDWLLHSRELEYLGFETREIVQDEEGYLSFFEFTKDIIMYPKDGVYDEYNLKAVVQYSQADEVFGDFPLSMSFDLFCLSNMKKGRLNINNRVGELGEEYFIFHDAYSAPSFSCNSKGLWDILNLHAQLSFAVERVGTMMELVPVDYWRNDWKEYCEGLVELHTKLTRLTSKENKIHCAQYLESMDYYKEQVKRETAF